MKYQILVVTDMEEVKDQVVGWLEALDDTDLKFKVAEAFDLEDSKELGDTIIWYHSKSHKQDRFFVGPPTKEHPKVQFSYKKVEAAGLSEKAAKLVIMMLTKIGYKDLKTDKSAAKLSVVPVPIKTNGDGSDDDAA